MDTSRRFHLFPILSATALMLTTMVASGRIFQDQNLLVGIWNANLEKSKRHPNHLFKSAKLRFSIADGVVTLNYTGVNMSGAEETGTTMFHPDGKQHPLEAMPGAVEVTRWVNPRTMETVASQNGKTIGQSTFEVSADGKILTATLRGNDSNGTWFEQVIVCDRE